jgi:hypothetical protein
MKATSIRYNSKNGGGKLTARMLEELCNAILFQTNKAGFITGANVENGSSISIGLHMSSFRVNTEKLGHNARLGDYIDSPKGYKRTDVPTWDQRVEFNNIVNKCFDKFHLDANIKSGPFTVRDKIKGANDEQDWENQTPEHLGWHGVAMNGMGQVMSEIVPESEARERCDSDRLEAEHKAKMRIELNAKAKERRQLARAFKNAKRVTVAGLSDWPKKNKLNGATMTHKAFEKMCSKLDSWELKRVRKASIEATVEIVEVHFETHFGNAPNVVQFSKVGF